MFFFVVFVYSDFKMIWINFFLFNVERWGFNLVIFGYFCKDIVVSGILVRSGEYWIDFENSGNFFRVFCDMLINGGRCDLVKMINIYFDNCWFKFE